jgi:hypothetical protein
MPKLAPTAAEYQFLLNENDQLRAEIVALQNELTELKRGHKELGEYVVQVWDDNRRLHAELRYFNKRELKKV